MLKSLKNNKGFTLVEVIAAFAVLAIISGALLQMFLSSAIANSKAQEIDRANMFCVKVGELFKVNPDLIEDSIDGLIGAGEAYGDAPWIPSGGNLEKKFNRPLTSDYSNSIAITDQKYKLSVTVKKPAVTGGMQSSYFPSTLCTLNLKPSPTMPVTYDLNIENALDDTHFIASVTSSVYSDAISTPIEIPSNAVIPILLEADSEFVNNLTIRIINSARYGSNPAKVDVYVGNVDSAILDVTPVSGLSSYTPVETAINSAYLYEINIKVYKMEDQGGTLVEKQQLSDNDAGKYYSKKE